MNIGMMHVPLIDGILLMFLISAMAVFVVRVFWADALGDRFVENWDFYSRKMAAKGVVISLISFRDCAPCQLKIRFSLTNAPEAYLQLGMVRSWLLIRKIHRDQVLVSQLRKRCKLQKLKEPKI